MDYKIYYSGYPAVLERYNDANWISDVVELYVTSVDVFTLGGCWGIVPWAASYNPKFWIKSVPSSSK
jgi:hypothetical protein